MKTPFLRHSSLKIISQNETKLLKKENTKLKRDAANRIIKNLIQLLTIIISFCTFYFGITQFFYNQRIIDLRKYNNAYYDERYSVLKDITKSISEINTIIMYSTEEKFSEDKINEISRKMTVFSYAYLVLNENRLNDSLVLSGLLDYQDYVFLKLDNEYIDIETLDLKGIETIKQIGNILTNEKDSINSFDFRLFSF